MYHRELKAMLKRHEGEVRNKAGRHVVYDDATGEPLKKGDKIKGHPTIGWGINVEALGIEDKHAELMLMDHVFELYKQLSQTFPSFRKLSRTRQDVITDMAFNMGIKRLKGFKNMWASINDALVSTDEHERAGIWNEVKAHMLDSTWHSQVPFRAEELATMMERDAYVKESVTA